MALEAEARSSLESSLGVWCQAECCVERDDPSALPRSTTYSFGVTDVFVEESVRRAECCIEDDPSVLPRNTTYSFGVTDVLDEESVLPSFKDSAVAPKGEADECLAPSQEGVGASTTQGEETEEVAHTHRSCATSIGMCNSEAKEVVPPCPLLSRPSCDIGGGVTYTGQWLGEVRHGQGVLRTAQGQVYFGDIRNNIAHGSGMAKEENGAVYRGQWNGGMRHGHGKLICEDGSTYEGAWHEDKQHGEGVEVYPDGCYQGQFVGGCRHGTGNLAGAGFTYAGQFRSGEMDGSGRCLASDGRSYEGEWRRGGKGGRGVTKWPSGVLHEGEYLRDHKHGRGCFVWPDGRSYKGLWENDELVGDRFLIAEGVEPCGHRRRVGI